MDAVQIKETILRELPLILKQDVDIQRLVLRLSQDKFADKVETESRFDQILGELRRDREEQTRQWQENQAILRQMMDDMRRIERKHETHLTALGARWGLSSEAAFREGLKGILEESFPVRVLRVLEYDAEGEVFGRPDQVELDLVIQNGTIIACEIKSSTSKADVYLFQRKVAYYERLHGRPVARRIIISPMIAPQARTMAEQLGIELYADPENVPL